MVFQPDSNSELIWIGKTDPIPDTCCQCGAFTYDRTTVRHVDEMVTQKRNDGCSAIVLTLVLHVFLGPIGWILHLFLESDEPGKTKVVKKKSKLKIAQCPMCQSLGPPPVVESEVYRFSFLVHPKFKSRFLELKQKLREQLESD